MRGVNKLLMAEANGHQSCDGIGLGGGGGGGAGWLDPQARDRQPIVKALGGEGGAPRGLPDRQVVWCLSQGAAQRSSSSCSHLVFLSLCRICYGEGGFSLILFVCNKIQVIVSGL